MTDNKLAESARKIVELEAEIRSICEREAGTVKQEFALQDRAEAAEVQLAERDAEIVRLREALTPSGATKHAYIGEFKFGIEDLDEDYEECIRSVTVPWTTIKEIMKAILARATIATPVDKENE